eukprot:2399681-Amphidinium_carterae.2
MQSPPDSNSSTAILPQIPPQCDGALIKNTPQSGHLGSTSTYFLQSVGLAPQHCWLLQLWVFKVTGLPSVDLLESCGGTSRVLKDVSLLHRGDTEIAEAAAQQGGWALLFAAPLNVVAAALRQDGRAIEWASRDSSGCFEARLTSAAVRYSYVQS